MGNGQTVCGKYLLCLYLFEYQDNFQTNTNIRIIRITDIRMRTLLHTLHQRWTIMALQYQYNIGNMVLQYNKQYWYKTTNKFQRWENIHFPKYPTTYWLSNSTLSCWKKVGQMELVWNLVYHWLFQAHIC